MIRYIVKRVVMVIPVLLIVILIIFTLMDLAPGSIVDAMITSEMTQDDVIVLREMYDLDKPMLYRYGKYLLGLLKGDLGDSMVSKLPVWDLYMSRWPMTLQLSFLSLILGIAIAIPLGIFAAKHAGSIMDSAATAFSLIGLSMPGFWLGLLLLMVFAYRFRIFPAAYDGTWQSYVLPVVACGFSMSANITRQTRSAILEVVRQDYLRTARAKGVPEWQITTRHELRNAWIPIIAQIGNVLGFTLAGSAVIEAVYSWPGVGTMIVEAIGRRDVTLACGAVVLTCIVYVFLYLLVDLMYALVDPRIKSQYQLRHKKRKGA